MTARNGGIQGTLNFSATELAAAAVTADPSKSDRAIAADIGVSDFTVRKARKKLTASSHAVETRVGKDGKVRRVPTRQAPVAVATTVANVAPRSHRRGNVVIGGTLAATGIILAAGGMLMTVNYTVATATGLDRILLAGLAAAADVLALIAPSAAIGLWHARRRSLALAACVLWLIAASITLQNLGGFVGAYGDALVSGRLTASTERALVLERVARLRAERGAISERRPVGVIVVAIRNATTAKIDDERTALAIARRRDELDAQLATIEATIPTLPAVSAADPSAATISGVVSLISGGQVIIADDMFRKLRLTLLLALPLLGGLILATGTALAATAKGRAP